MEAPNPIDELNGSRSSNNISHQPFLVFYDQGLYDLTDFAHKHPGGRNTLSGLRNRDIAKRLQTAPPHSKAAMYLMQEYRVKNQADANNNSNESAEQSTIPEMLTRSEDERFPLPNRTDESMEVSRYYMSPSKVYLVLLANLFLMQKNIFYYIVWM